MPSSQSRILKLLISTISNPSFHSSQPILNYRSTTLPFSFLRRFTSIDGGTRGPIIGERENSRSDKNRFSIDSDGDENVAYNDSVQNPPEPIPNRPLRGERPHSPQSGEQRSFRGENRGRPQSGNPLFSSKFNRGNEDAVVGDIDSKNEKKPSRSFEFLNRPFSEGKRDEQSEDSLLERFKLGEDKSEKNQPNAAATQVSEEQNANSDEGLSEPMPPPEDAAEIFKKMKETGLVPNAVAMLDGLCKDGLVQEAMKLFGSMRDKGTIPDVVIYTAVVDGFCKAHKLDDAKRIFKKMQTNGISPNAFSYTVLIRGLCKSNRLEDAVEFCMEMIDAGHSPNVSTFTGLVDGLCREKGVEEAQSIISDLRQKGFFINEKAVRDFLDKKARVSSMVWEAIFGTKSSKKPF